MFKNAPIVINGMVTSARPVKKDGKETGGTYLEVCTGFGKPPLPFFVPKELGITPGEGEALQMQVEMASRPVVKHSNGKPFATMDLEVRVLAIRECPDSALELPGGSGSSGRSVKG